MYGCSSACRTLPRRYPTARRPDKRSVSKKSKRRHTIGGCSWSQPATRSSSPYVSAAWYPNRTEIRQQQQQQQKQQQQQQQHQPNRCERISRVCHRPNQVLNSTECASIEPSPLTVKWSVPPLPSMPAACPGRRRLPAKNFRRIGRPVARRRLCRPIANAAAPAAVST